jgi:putative hydrolase
MPNAVISEYLDIVLAGFHDGTGYTGTTMEENTKAMVAAIKNPHVHIITHPGNPKFPVDLETVVRAAKDCNKALELNNSSFKVRPGSFPVCSQIAKLAKKYNILVSINSDAHICYNVGENAKAVALASKEGIRKNQIINSSSSEISEYLNWHKQQSKLVYKKAQ